MMNGEKPIVTSFVGALGAPEPRARGQTAEDAKPVKRPRGHRHSGHRNTSSSEVPRIRTTTGIQKWASVTMARNVE